MNSGGVSTRLVYRFLYADLASSNTGNSDHIETHAVKVHYESATDESQNYKDSL
jgi:hypothetical protein